MQVGQEAVTQPLGSMVMLLLLLGKKKKKKIPWVEIKFGFQVKQIVIRFLTNLSPTHLRPTQKSYQPWLNQDGSPWTLGGNSPSLSWWGW